ncbi:four helix bundle protein [Halotia wernerae UHCC 0503]|nr:four helix bundle protein [Halotia wernerae UHCC 0503]
MNQDITERTFEFAVRIVKLCQSLEEIPGVPRTLAKQLLRSGTSIAANVEEARAGQSKADFIHKNAIALKEVRETNYWLRLLVATGSILFWQIALRLEVWGYTNEVRLRGLI